MHTYRNVEVPHLSLMNSRQLSWRILVRKIIIFLSLCASGYIDFITFICWHCQQVCRNVLHLGCTTNNRLGRCESTALFDRSESPVVGRIFQQTLLWERGTNVQDFSVFCGWSEFARHTCTSHESSARWRDHVPSNRPREHQQSKCSIPTREEERAFTTANSKRLDVCKQRRTRLQNNLHLVNKGWLCASNHLVNFMDLLPYLHKIQDITMDRHIHHANGSN